MSSVLVSVFANHSAAKAVRTSLVSDGFATDRVDLTSREELGHVKLVPRDTLEEQLNEYFTKVLQVEPPAGQREVSYLRQAVLKDEAVLVVQPRGEVENQRAVELLRQGGPLDITAKDLDDTFMEQAATDKPPSTITWVGKALIGAGARDTTGTPKLP